MLSAMIKALLTALAVAIGLFLAGITGLLFRVWPTGLGDDILFYSQETELQLKALKAERKFEPDHASFYPGAPDETTRLAAQASVDSVIDGLLLRLPHDAHRSTVLSAFKAGLPHLDRFDSEERDRALVYMQRIMDITGVHTSRELLNVWRYGFPYGWLRGA
jgi:hypothetical protein